MRTIKLPFVGLFLCLSIIGANAAQKRMLPVLPPIGPGSWSHWNDYPISIAISYTADVRATMGSTFTITINGQTYTDTADGCMTVRDVPSQSISLRPHQQYQFVVSGELDLFHIYFTASTRPAVRAGGIGNLVPTGYRIFIDGRELSTTNFSGGCTLTSVAHILEIKPDGGQRPDPFAGDAKGGGNAGMQIGLAQRVGLGNGFGNGGYASAGPAGNYKRHEPRTGIWSREER